MFSYWRNLMCVSLRERILRQFLFNLGPPLKYTLLGSSINHVDRFLDIFDPLPLCGPFILLNKAFLVIWATPLPLSCSHGLWMTPLPVKPGRKHRKINFHTRSKHKDTLGNKAHWKIILRVFYHYSFRGLLWFCMTRLFQFFFFFNYGFNQSPFIIIKGQWPSKSNQT